MTLAILNAKCYHGGILPISAGNWSPSGYCEWEFIQSALRTIFEILNPGNLGFRPIAPAGNKMRSHKAREASTLYSFRASAQCLLSGLLVFIAAPWASRRPCLLRRSISRTRKEKRSRKAALTAEQHIHDPRDVCVDGLHPVPRSS